MPDTLPDNGPEGLPILALMLIRVVRAVNDFILSASFSDKSIRSDVTRGLPRRFFVENVNSGEDRTLYAVWSASASFSAWYSRRRWLSLLLFPGFCFNCLI
jgi:hypothetical protein